MCVLLLLCVCVCVREWHFYKPGDERSDKPSPLPDCSLQLHLGLRVACGRPSAGGVSSLLLRTVCLSLCHLAAPSVPFSVCVWAPVSNCHLHRVRLPQRKHRCVYVRTPVTSLTGTLFTPVPISTSF